MDWNYNYLAHVNLLSSIQLVEKLENLKNIYCSEFLLLMILVCPFLQLSHVCLLGFCWILFEKVGEN